MLLHRMHIDKTARRRRIARPKDTIGDLLNPCRNDRERLRRKGKKPINHAKINRMVLAERQQINRLQQQVYKKQEERRAKKERWKNKQFRKTPSKISEARKKYEPEKKHSYLKRSPKTNFIRTPPKSFVRKRELKTPPVPRMAKKPPPLPPPSDPVDFIARNVQRADELKPPPPPAADNPWHDTYGEVPPYLVARKLRWAKKQERQRLMNPSKDPDCPAGMRVVGEEERQATLQFLLDSYKLKEAAFNRLSLAPNTLSQQRKHDDLGQELQKIEDAIQLFNRPKVFVMDTAVQEEKKAAVNQA